jgi:hypothetical protein
MESIRMTEWTQSLKITADQAWELRRSQTAYIEYCDAQVQNTEYGRKFPDVFLDKIIGAQQMIEMLDIILEGFGER